MTASGFYHCGSRSVAAELPLGKIQIRANDAAQRSVDDCANATFANSQRPEHVVLIGIKLGCKCGIRFGGDKHR